MAGIEVRRATPSDLAAVTATLHEAFRHDPISSWIFPDAVERERLHPGLMRLFADLGLSDGEVWLAPDAAGVAVWFPVDPAEQPPSDFLERAVAHCGAYGERFRALDMTMSKHHPTGERHLYLNLLAVRPSHHGRGLGTALLRDRLRRLDTLGMAAYLETGTPRAAALYAREGFVRRPTFGLDADGPKVQPMWRDSARAGQRPIPGWGVGRHRAEP